MRSAGRWPQDGGRHSFGCPLPDGSLAAESLAPLRTGRPYEGEASASITAFPNICCRKWRLLDSALAARLEVKLQSGGMNKRKQTTPAVYFRKGRQLPA